VHCNHEPLAGNLRWGPIATDPRQPYIGCCTVLWLSPTEVELRGIDVRTTEESNRAVAACLYGLGVRRVRVERIRRGRSRWIWWKLKKGGGIRLLSRSARDPAHRVLAALRLATEAIRRGQTKGAETALQFLDIAMEKMAVGGGPQNKEPRGPC